MDKNEKISGYREVWDLNDHRGGVVLIMEAGDTTYLRLENPAEFNAVIDILRNEKPVYYDRKRQFIQTGEEPIGEGEE